MINGGDQLHKGAEASIKYSIIKDGNGIFTNVSPFVNFTYSDFKYGDNFIFKSGTTTTAGGIDTLDYSGSSINEGSKLVVAAYGDTVRELSNSLPACFENSFVSNPVVLMEGVVGLQLGEFSSYENAKGEMKKLNDLVVQNIERFKGIVQIVIYNDFTFKANDPSLNDYVWITYTRSNPSHDIYGVNEFVENKHWGCKGPMIIDARKKPHHAPELKLDPDVEKRISRFSGLF